MSRCAKRGVGAAPAGRPGVFRGSSGSAAPCTSCATGWSRSARAKSKWSSGSSSTRQPLLRLSSCALIEGLTSGKNATAHLSEESMVLLYPPPQPSRPGRPAFQDHQEAETAELRTFGRGCCAPSCAGTRTRQRFPASTSARPRRRQAAVFTGSAVISLPGRRCATCSAGRPRGRLSRRCAPRHRHDRAAGVARVATLPRPGLVFGCHDRLRVRLPDPARLLAGRPEGRRKEREWLPRDRAVRRAGHDAGPPPAGQRDRLAAVGRRAGLVEQRRRGAGRQVRASGRVGGHRPPCARCRLQRVDLAARRALLGRSAAAAVPRRPDAVATLALRPWRHDRRLRPHGGRRRTQCGTRAEPRRPVGTAAEPVGSGAAVPRPISASISAATCSSWR